MHIKKVSAHIYKDGRFDNWESQVQGHWTVEELRADPGYCNDWISFDSLAWDEAGKQLYIGLTSINNDIFHVFTPATNEFRSLNFKRISNKFDAKFHRSLEIDRDGMIYAATALLHDVDQQFAAPGGKLLRYDPSSDLYKVLDIPIPHQYIQSIKLDRQRKLIYGFTYPAEYLFCHDLESHRSRILAYIGNGVMMCQPHSSALDAQGRLWGTWGESRAFEDITGPTPIRIFCYDPDQDQFTWYQHGFPKTSPADPARIDQMLLAADGMIYAGSTSGGFSRLHVDSGSVEDLGKPYPGERLAGLVQTADGLIYGVGNAGYGPEQKGEARIFVFDPKTKHLEDLGPLFDQKLGLGAVKVHMMVVTADGKIFAGENDNIYRSSYLWEINIEK
jgi:hypothetical protein